MEEKKPRTTKQHLIDKLILGKLKLHERHRRMRQYGGNGERDLKLESAVASVEFDTEKLTIDKQRELKAKNFLKMVEIYIGQLEDELQQTVAKYVLAKLLAEDGLYIVMSYSPKKLRDEKKELYRTVENYKSLLEDNYKQVTLENRISKMFSSIVKNIPNGLNGSNEPLSRADIKILCRIVDDATYRWQADNNNFFISGIGLTPEEYSEFLDIYNREAKGDFQHGEAEIAAQCWIDEIQAIYQADLYFYNGFFRDRIKKRIQDLKKRKHRAIDIMNASKKYRVSGDDTSENNLNVEDLFDRINSDNLSPNPPDNPLSIVEREQARSLLSEYQAQLPPKEKRLLELKFLDATNEEIADNMNSEFTETSKTGKAKSFNKDNIRYPLEKLERSLETFLHSKGALSTEENLEWLKRNKKPSLKRSDSAIKEEKNND